MFFDHEIYDYTFFLVLFIIKLTSTKGTYLLFSFIAY